MTGRYLLQSVSEQRFDLTSEQETMILHGDFILGDYRAHRPWPSRRKDFTMMKILQIVASAAIFGAGLGEATAQSNKVRAAGSGATGTNPDTRSYGPGTYTEGGSSVTVPRQCYASREQRLEGGRLVWRPLVTCPFDDYR